MTGVLKALTEPGVWTPVNGGQINLPSAVVEHAVIGNALTTSGTTVLTVATLNIPAYSIPGRLAVSGYMRVQMSVAADVFVCNLEVSSSVIAQFQTRQGTTYEWAVMLGTWALPANTAATITMTIVRSSGTGTATTNTSGAHNTLQATFIPDNGGSSIDYGSLDSRFVKLEGDEMSGQLRIHPEPYDPVHLKLITDDPDTEWVTMEFWQGGERRGYCGLNPGGGANFVGTETYARLVTTGTGNAIVTSDNGEVNLVTNATNQVRVLNDGVITFGGAKTGHNFTQTGMSYHPIGACTLVGGESGAGVFAANHNGTNDANGQTFGRYSRTTSGTIIGSITQVNTTGVAFNVGSDESRKDNVVEVDDELAEWVARIVQPLMFSFKETPDITQMGYIAQRVAAAWPQAIECGVVTPSDEEGGWQMDYSKLVPIIHAAWQSTARKLDALTARVEALEGK